MTRIVPTLLVLLAAPAFAGDWTTTFNPAAVASHFDGGKAAFIVIGAGPASASLDAAAAALEASLREGGKADLVLNSKSVPNVGDLDDAAIVAKCAVMPVARVAIVRVFEPSVVVTVYDTKGAVVVAFSGQAGTALAARAAGEGQGVSAGAVNAVTAVTNLATADSASAREEFEKQFVWFADWVGVNQYGTVVSSWSEPMQGKYKKPLPGAELYDAVGRADLAEKYRKVSTSNGRWGTAGLLLFFGAPALAVGGAYLDGVEAPEREFTSCFQDANQTACEAARDAADKKYEDDDAAHSSAQWTWAIAGGVGSLLGIVVALVGTSNPHPVTPSEARQLVDEHNKSLKKARAAGRRAPADGGERAGAGRGRRIRADARGRDGALARAVLAARPSLTLPHHPSTVVIWCPSTP